MLERDSTGSGVRKNEQAKFKPTPSQLTDLSPILHLFAQLWNEPTLQGHYKDEVVKRQASAWLTGSLDSFGAAVSTTPSTIDFMTCWKAIWSWDRSMVEVFKERKQ